MRYQTLPIEGLANLVKRNLDGDPFDLEAEIVWCGDGDDVDLAPAFEVAERLREATVGNPSATSGDLEDLEARHAGELHRALCGLPTHILDDPGLWRFLSLGPFWEFVRAREAGAFDTGEPSKFLKYVDGRFPAECVPLRCYLRGAIAQSDDDYTLAHDPGRATDLWRSHILRVRTGSAPEVARALLRSQRSDRMGTDELRAFARRLNRTWTNVVLHAYDEDEADRLVQELRES